LVADYLNILIDFSSYTTYRNYLKVRFQQQYEFLVLVSLKV
jgi:hypothetical protein